MLLPALERIEQSLNGRGDPGRIETVDGLWWDVDGVTNLEATMPVAEVPLGERWTLIAFNCRGVILGTVPFHNLQENGRARLTWQCDQGGLIWGGSFRHRAMFDPGSILTLRTSIPILVGRHAGDAWFQFRCTPA